MASAVGSDAIHIEPTDWTMGRLNQVYREPVPYLPKPELQVAQYKIGKMANVGLDVKKSTSPEPPCERVRVIEAGHGRSLPPPENSLRRGSQLMLFVAPTAGGLTGQVSDPGSKGYVQTYLARRLFGLSSLSLRGALRQLLATRWDLPKCAVRRQLCSGSADTDRSNRYSRSLPYCRRSLARCLPPSMVDFSGTGRPSIDSELLIRTLHNRYRGGELRDG